MDPAEGRDDHGVDVGIVHELVGSVVDLGPVRLSGRNGGGVVDVGDGNDLAARHLARDTGEVGAAHAAGADESYANTHVSLLLE